MKLSKWAKLQGISYLTAYRWFKTGKIPSAIQQDSGTILVQDLLLIDSCLENNNCQHKIILDKIKKVLDEKN